MQRAQDEDDEDNFYNFRRRTNSRKQSENFQIIENPDTDFTNIGGYSTVKEELNQCIDMLTNYKKYQDYNVRVPKGLIFEAKSHSFLHTY
mgnify:CR=1 FL=1